MIIKRRYYPYPVLNPYSDDYVKSEFKIEKICHSQELNNYIFNIELFLNNKGILDLIEKNKAEYVVHVECPKTSFRNVYLSDSNKIKIKTKEYEIDGRVEINCFVIAKQNIKKYKNVFFHNDYGNLTFNVERGQFISISNSANVDIVKDTDDLRKLSSIIRISAISELDKEVRYDLYGERIYIRLSEEYYRSYIYASNSLINMRILHSMIIYPALIYVFQELKEDSGSNFDTYAEKKWFQSLRLQLKNKGIELNRELFEKDGFEPYQLAQKILDNPVSDALKAMSDMIDQEVE